MNKILPVCAGVIALTLISSAIYYASVKKECDKMKNDLYSDYFNMKKDLNNQYNNICSAFNKTYNAYTELDKRVSNLEDCTDA